MKNKFYRVLCMALISSFCAVQLPAQASSMLSTDSAIETHSERADVMAFLNRADVVNAMEKQGVNPADAQARVAALSDDEIHALNGRIHELPAGGDILGVVFTVFIVLLITDILGLTKVFPFTRSIR
ncbi:MAG: PA2779 family protein [Formivibrio sp.]|nr:PA2779 family protein [Formivibrio sp.]